ncbi:helix-turn-helix transcriptional regulator [Serratia bockelmannii]|uniref:helix-turn-helix transcriptional regulator n=1 Tax=Serratia bockelmannii TaxID=2703793 RepID=UPI00313D4ADA
MKFSEKLKAIRKAEDISQSQFGQLIDLPLPTIKKYESESYSPSIQNLMKITKHPRFKKYALWLTTDETAPEVGQISPALSLSGSEESAAAQASTKTTAKSHR